MSKMRIPKMPPTMMPFLYQTRTLQSLRFARTFSQTVRRAAWPDKPEPEDEFDDADFDHTRSSNPSKPEYAKPSWDRDLPFIGLEEEAQTVPEVQTPHRQSTMSPTETETFRQIFDEISSGKMPKAKQMEGEPKGREMLTRTSKLLHEDEEKPKTLNFFQREAEKIQSNIREQSILDQARQLSDFKDKILPSYPADLQDAAKAALNLNKDGEKPEIGLQRMIPTKEQRQHQAKVEDMREEERKRLDAAFAMCWTDTEYWDLMEKEIFSLPPKLGLLADVPTPGEAKKKKKKKKTPSKSKDEIAELSLNMDIYGPLVSRYVNRALDTFDRRFAYPSLLSYNILPRLKSLGLSAYVLAVSTTFYTRLARIHWERHGDPVTALNLLQEMYSIGLTPNAETGTLLIEMQEELGKCAKGQQGLFVAAVMDSPPYDGDLMGRLGRMEDEVRYALKNQGLPVQ